MPDAALAGAGGLHLAGRRGLDGIGEFLHGLVGRGCADLDAGRIFVHQRQRRVAPRRQFGQSLPVHHRDFHRQHADGVAVGLCRGDRGMADHAGAAGAIDHVEGLAEVLLQQCCDNARGRIGTAARAPRHDQGHWARGIGFRGGWLETEGHAGCGSGGRGRERAACDLGHGVLPVAPVNPGALMVRILGGFALRSQGVGFRTVTNHLTDNVRVPRAHRRPSSSPLGRALAKIATPSGVKYGFRVSHGMNATYWPSA